MLRRTTRLSMILALNGEGIYRGDDDDGNDDFSTNWVKTSFEEAELIHENTESTHSSYFAYLKSEDVNKVAFHIFPLTDFPPSGEEAEQGAEGPADCTNTDIPDDTILPDGATFDILWLSKTEFITRHYVEEEEEPDLLALCAVTVQLREEMLHVQSYHVNSRFDGEESGDIPAARSLRFLVDYLVPVLDSVPVIDVLFLGVPPPVDATLLLLPTSASSRKKSIRIVIKDVSGDLVRALASYPVHRQVRLCLEARSDLTAREMNDALRVLKHPVHLQIPHKLMKFSSENEAFTANPAFESLAIDLNGFPPLSSKMMDGIARNTSITHLTINAPGWMCDKDTCFGDRMSWVTDMISWVASQSFVHVQSLTLNNEETLRCRTIMCEQEAFDELTRLLDSASTVAMAYRVYY
jgi:hypothetical protein